MTLTLLVAGFTLVCGAVGVLSFRVGRSRGFGEIFHVRMQAAQARRRMHDLTREAFEAMAEEAERRRRA